MIRALIKWCLENRLAVIVVALVVFLAGAWMTLRLPVDVFPDLTAPTVTVVVEGHGMAVEEMERLVTFPMETAVNGAADVRRIRSATALGIAVVWIEFDWGADVYRARQTVTERLSAIAGQLPAGVGSPVLAPVSSIMGEILFASLTSDRHTPMELRTTAETDVRRRLLSVTGVSKVTPIGGDEKQYQVVLSPSRLAAYGIGIDQVIDVLRNANENVSAGIVVRGSQESVVRGFGRIRTTNDIASTVVSMRDDAPITVGDLGEVRIGAALKRGVASASRRGPEHQAVTEPAVILAIQKQPEANTLELTDRLDEVLDEIQASLPDGMVINKNLFRFIQAAVDNTAMALLEGSLMVIAVVVLFLLSMRASFITLLSIPISLCIAILTLRTFGAGINTMTLGGMAIAIGALVDDAIIDVENVVRRLRSNAGLPEGERKGPLRVILDASIEVRSSIVFATLIILLVFAPLFFLSGVEGRLLQPLGVAFTVSLAASLLTALTLTPALCSLLLTRSRTVSRTEEPRPIRWLKRIYAGRMELALRHPKSVFVPTLVLFAVSVFGLTRVGREFLPEFNEGSLVVGAVTLPGTSLEASDRLARRAELALMEHPEVIAIGRRTGRAEEDEHVQGVEASELEVSLGMGAPERIGLQRRSKAQLMAAIRDDLSAIPGIETTIGQPISHRIDHMLSGTQANIAIKIFGDDLVRLREIAARIREVMEGIEGVVDLSVEKQASVSSVQVSFDRSALARHGLTIHDAAEALEAACLGLEVSRVIEGNSMFALTVRVEQGSGAYRELLGSIQVDAPTGAKIPLAAIASIRDDRGPNFVGRENAQRRIVVSCNVAGRDVGSVIQEAQREIESRVELPPGYHVQYGGQFESARETTRTLSILGALVILGVGFLLHMVFGSVRDALLIMVNLPLALIGGVAGVHLSGGVLSVASMIGFITVFGIAARNGILLVSHIRHLQLFEGVRDFGEAVRRGALERLVPVLMTALAAGLALVPLALRAEDPGTEILTPMAIVILFGLLSSTFLNMIVVPSLYLWLGVPARADGSERLEEVGS